MRTYLPFIAAAFAVCACSASAEEALPAPGAVRVVPKVIYDGGGVPIGEYLHYITPEKKRDTRPVAAQARPITMFPVASAKARPGRLDRPFKAKLPGGPDIPICIIGDDQLSRQWLALNLAALEKMHAACMVTSVVDAASFQRLHAEAGTLPLAISSIDGLAEAAGITVWPVLITPDGLVSQ
jgi:integrating conjugative element protein (TIGR03765 family)